MDGAAQIIVGAELTQESNDKRQLAPMPERVEQNLGAGPVSTTADAGYFSEEQVNDERVKGIDLYIATGKQKHGQPEPAAAMPAAESDSAVEKMKQKLKTETGQALYKMRKGDCGAGLRTNQGRARHPRLSAPRTGEDTGGMEADLHHP